MDSEAAKAERQGWIVAFASMIALAFGAVGLLSYTQGIFMEPVLKEYGFSRGWYFGAYSLGGIIQAFCAPALGRIADKWGVRRVLLPGTIIFGISVILLAAFNGSPMQFAVLTVFAGITSLFAGPPLYSRVVSAWVDKRRGLALAVALAGSGLAGFFMPRLTVYLIGDFGWREARVLLGILHIIVLVPLIYFFIFEPREKAGASTERAEAAKVGVSVPEALRNWVFWALCAIEFFSGGAVNSSMVTFVPIAQSVGFGAVAAAAAISYVGVAQIAGRFISGSLLDYIRSPKSGIVLLISAMIGIVLVFYGHSQLTLTLGALFIGAGLGAELELAAYYVSRYFGLKNFAAIYGGVFAGFVIGGSVGITGINMAFDRFHSYGTAFYSAEISLVIGVLIILILPRYVFLPDGKEG